MKSRSRTKFVQELYPIIHEFDSWRMKGVEKYANKDETNSLIIIEDGYSGKMEYEFTTENRQKFEEEVKVYLAEKVDVNIGPKLMEDYGFVKGLIFNTQTEFKGAQAEEYHKWCVSLEANEIWIDEEVKEV